jgi:predicted Zn-dependent protease
MKLLSLWLFFCILIQSANAQPIIPVHIFRQSGHRVLTLVEAKKIHKRCRKVWRRAFNERLKLMQNTPIGLFEFDVPYDVTNWKDQNHWDVVIDWLEGLNWNDRNIVSVVFPPILKENRRLYLGRAETNSYRKGKIPLTTVYLWNDNIRLSAQIYCHEIGHVRGLTHSRKGVMTKLPSLRFRFSRFSRNEFKEKNGR